MDVAACLTRNVRRAGPGPNGCVGTGGGGPELAASLWVEQEHPVHFSGRKEGRACVPLNNDAGKGEGAGIKPRIWRRHSLMSSPLLCSLNNAPVSRTIAPAPVRRKAS
jgi:hypothetical protein